MHITYFFRKPQPQYHSIERVFRIIIGEVGKKAETTIYHLNNGDKGLFSRIKALFEVRKNKGAINHITGDISYVALALPKKGLIITFHDLESLERSSIIRSWLLRLIWVVMPARRAEKITVISEHTKKRVLKWAKIEESKITVIPNPLPQGFEFTPKEFNTAKPTILSIGTKPNKNLEGTIEGVKNIDCKLIVAGRLTKHQLNLLENYGVEYENIVGATDSQIIDAYRRCDILCFPSFYEGFGMPIIEAQAVGRPVISTSYGAMTETAGINAAILINPKKPTEIEDAIIKLQNDTSIRESLIKNGLKNAERFMTANVVEGYYKVYEGVLG